MTDNIKLPKLPKWLSPPEKAELQAYATAAIEPYAKRIAELEAALQSQDMKSVIEALETAQNNECGPRRPFGSGDPNSDDYEHDAFMWDYYQRAIERARRVEGVGNDKG